MSPSSNNDLFWHLEYKVASKRCRRERFSLLGTYVGSVQLGLTAGPNDVMHGVHKLE